jgi:RHS repeat-associated protein
VQGRQTLAIDFEGHVTQFVYDDVPQAGHSVATGQLIEKKFFDNLTQYDGGAGTAVESVSYQYDEFGRTTSVSTIRRDPLTGVVQAPDVVTTTYTAQGQIESITSAQGTIHYAYDPVNGQQTQTWTGTDPDAPVNDFGYTFDKLGRLSTVTVYRRNSQTLSTPEVSQYQYDLLGNLVRLFAANGDVTEYVYDSFNRLIRLTNYAPDSTPNDVSDNAKLSEFQYDVKADGSRSAAHEDFWDVDSNGNVLSHEHHDITWLYDQINRLVEEDYSSSDADSYIAHYSFDLTGNRLQKTTDWTANGTGIDETVNSVYDANDRLLTETQVDASMAAGVDQLTTFGYDHTTQTSKTVQVEGVEVNGAIGSQITSQVNYTYNVQGQLALAIISEYGNVGDGPAATWIEIKRTIASYTYDESGIRITATEEILEDSDQNPETDLTESSFTSTKYLNDPQNLTGYSQVLQETQRGATNQIIKTIISTVGLDVLAQATYGQPLPTEGMPLVLLYDGHGSTRMLANAAGLLAVIASTPQQFQYDAYGNAIAFDPANAATSLLYSGEQWDQRIQMQYLRARYYDASRGRFLGLDRFAGKFNDPQSLHKYVYTNNNPANYIDPTGRFEGLVSFQVAIGISATLAGTGVGYLAGGWKGALVGALVGAAAGTYVAVFYGQYLAIYAIGMWAELSAAVGGAIATGSQFVQGPYGRTAVSNIQRIIDLAKSDSTQKFVTLYSRLSQAPNGSRWLNAGVEKSLADAGNRAGRVLYEIRVPQALLNEFTKIGAVRTESVTEIADGARGLAYVFDPQVIPYILEFIKEVSG